MDRRSSSILIAIEGIDGAGKTTQVGMLKAALDSVGEAVITSKEPTNGQWGRVIKESASAGRHSAEEELELFIKDRTEHVDTVVNPALDSGKTVILDRYFYSTIAYQGCRGMNVGEVRAAMESRFPVPDAVFILDIDPVLSVHRIANSRGEQPNHFEDRANLAMAREIFNSLSAPTIHHIDGAMSRQSVHSELLEKFIDGPLKAKRCAKHYGCDDPFHCGFRLTGTCDWIKLAGALRSLRSSAATLGNN